MGRLSLAFRAFWGVLSSGQTAERVEAVLSGKYLEPPAETAAEEAEKQPAREPKSDRSDALNLLATLQREARFIDFLKESLEPYSDAQVKAAALDVHRGCAEVIDRMFDVQPLLDQEEGEPVEVPAGYDSGKFRLTGNVSGEPPYQGALCHHGWQASKCELPQWTGSEASALVVAPAEVELS